MLFCETRSCNARRHNDLEGHSKTFSVLLFIVSLFCAWNITTVEINSGVHLFKSLICEVPSFTFGGLGLVILVLFLRFDFDSTASIKSQ